MNVSAAGYKKNPLSSLVVTWALLIPLLFLAIHGQPWFLGPNTNMFIPIGAGALAGHRTTSESLFEQGIEVIVMAVFYAMATTRLKSAKSILHQNALLVCIVFWVLASTVWSQFPITTLQFSVVFVSNILLAVFLSSRFMPEEQMMLLAALGTIAAGLTAIVAVFLPVQGIDLKEGGNTAWQGIFNHKNDCAIVLSYLLTCFFFSSTLRRRRPLARRIAISLILFVVVMSESRTGWILVATFFTYIAIVKVNSRFEARSRTVLYLAAFVLLTATALILAFNASEFFHSLGKSSSASGRTLVWLTVMRSILKHPLFGYGYHAFFMGMQGESANTASIWGSGVPLMHSQSGFLDVWLELGVIGLILVSFAIWRALKNGVLCVIKSDSLSAQWYLSIVLLTVVANIGERNLMCCNFLDWIMFLIAYIGLNREAKALRSIKGNQPLSKPQVVVHRTCAA